MRKSTALVASVVALSAVVISLRMGELEAQQLSQLTIKADDKPKPETTTSAVPPTPSEAPNPIASQSPVPGKTTKPRPEPVAPVTVSSDPISYKYGVVQVSVTKVGTEITGLEVLQGETSNGRGEAYKILAEATIQTQGTNYGNVSGATFTTEAYKLAVESALSKF